MRALMWFRADLRLRDNPALHAAAKAATRGVVAVFTVCPRQWRAHDWGDVKVEFLLRNLACLAQQLRERNIALRIVERATFAQVPAALAALAAEVQCDALFFNREHEVDEQRRDAAVQRRFEQDGRSVHRFEDQTILPPGAVSTKAGGFFTVFTPFKRAWLARLEAEAALDPLPVPRRQDALVCAPDPVPEEVADFQLTRGLPELWPAGADLAARRLTTYIAQRLDDYQTRRDLPGVDGTSRLSPYLTAGVLSARTCFQAALEANGQRLQTGRNGPLAWMSELIWREFYRHVLVGYPRVSMGCAFRPETETIPWRVDDEGFAAWCAGRTGVPLVDAGLRQLAETGWMHNRVRMVAAMFLTKNLLIDWRRGEGHFMRHLVDGDLASNNGGWQWSASTGTDAAPYFRVFNPFTQGQRFDPDGDYIRRYVPELRDVRAADLHDLRPAGAEARACAGYPPPICDIKASAQRAVAAFRRAPSGPD